MRASPTHPRLEPHASQARGSDSRAFLDSDECERARFEVDWRAALDHKLREHILRSNVQDRSSGATSWGEPDTPALRAAAAAETSDEAEDEHRLVIEVREVLWEHHDVLYMVFAHYASLAANGDKFSINLNSFHTFYVDCKLFVPNSVACQKKHLDQLFIAVNASGKGSGRAERHNHARQLNRQESLRFTRSNPNPSTIPSPSPKP